MKKNTILIGGLLTAIGAGKATLKIDNKMYYFSNDVIAGVGVSIVAHQLNKLKKEKCKC